MRVTIWPIRKAGSWGYLAGSWGYLAESRGEATLDCIAILKNIKGKMTLLHRKFVFFVKINQLGVRTILHNLGIVTQDAT